MPLRPRGKGPFSFLRAGIAPCGGRQIVDKGPEGTGAVIGTDYRGRVCGRQERNRLCADLQIDKFSAGLGDPERGADRVMPAAPSTRRLAESGG